MVRLTEAHLFLFHCFPSSQHLQLPRDMLRSWSGGCIARTAAPTATLFPQTLSTGFRWMSRGKAPPMKRAQKAKSMPADKPKPGKGSPTRPFTPMGQTLNALKKMNPQVEESKQVNLLTSKKSTDSPRGKPSRPAVAVVGGSSSQLKASNKVKTTPRAEKPIDNSATPAEGGDSALAMLDSFRHSFLTQVPRAKYLSIALLEELSGLNMVVVGGPEEPLQGTIIDPAVGTSSENPSSSSVDNSIGLVTGSQKARQQLFLRAETHTRRYSRALVYHPEKGFVTDSKRARDVNYYNFTVTYASPDQSKPLRTVIGVGKTSGFITDEVKGIYEKWGFETHLA
jgi:hypothetical protein